MCFFRKLFLLIGMNWLIRLNRLIKLIRKKEKEKEKERREKKKERKKNKCCDLAKI
jgi:hypothetical protein